MAHNTADSEELLQYSECLDVALDTGAPHDVLRAMHGMGDLVMKLLLNTRCHPPGRRAAHVDVAWASQERHCTVIVLYIVSRPNTILAAVHPARLFGSRSKLKGDAAVELRQAARTLFESTMAFVERSQRLLVPSKPVPWVRQVVFA
ncbi:hypothetical protein AURDEDRAFT_159505 [Auricularia subglabra TFB-10046 SS5]|nr:hypothetical protein AURDEDRAFT_159505 [Auricularia subglabra TFB-10046 SS5]